MPQGGAGGMPNGQPAGMPPGGGSPAGVMPASAGGAPNWQSYFSGLAQQQPNMASFAQAAAAPSGASLLQAPQIAMPDFSAWQPTQQGAVPAQSAQPQAGIPDLGQMLAQINAQKAAAAAAAAANAPPQGSPEINAAIQQFIGARTGQAPSSVALNTDTYNQWAAANNRDVAQGG